MWYVLLKTLQSEERNKIVGERIKRRIVVSLFCIFNFPYYEETYLNKVIIYIMLEKPLHGNE